MINIAVSVAAVVIGWFPIICYLFGGPHGLALGTGLVAALVIPIAMLMAVPLWK